MPEKVKRGGRKRKYTNAQLIGQLRALRREIGRRPTDRDINAACKRGRCASAMTYVLAFGSMRAAYRAAGFGDVPPRPYTKEEAHRALMRMMEETGEFPTYRQIDEASRAGRGPSSKTITARLGLLGVLKRGEN